MSVQIRAIQSLRLERFLTQTILASIWAPSLAGSPTFTGTDRRYLERPRRFLHALKICLTFIRFSSNSYVILELFFTMAITFKPRWLIWTIWWGLENQVSNMTYLAVSPAFKAWYYIGPLWLGHNPPLGRDCALVDLLGRPDDILIVLWGQEWWSDWDKGGSISPTHGHHSKALLVGHRNVVEYFGSQLSLLVSSSRVERIVKDEAIGTLIRSQIFQVPIDDPLS